MVDPIPGPFYWRLDSLRRSLASARLIWLSSWSREMYDSAKASGSLTSLLPQLPGIASFEASDEARIKELHTLNESLDYDRATATYAGLS
jgi:hypothetical protein